MTYHSLSKFGAVVLAVGHLLLFFFLCKKGTSKKKDTLEMDDFNTEQRDTCNFEIIRTQARTAKLRQKVVRPR